MKILLVAPPKRGLEGSEEHPPIGLGYLATMLRREEYIPEIKDCVIEQWKIEDLINYIKVAKPDVVGITTFSQAMSYVKDILERIKEYNSSIITIVGGPHPTAVPETTLCYFEKADYGISGEGEIPLKYLMEFLSRKRKKLNDVPGLIWRENNNVCWNVKVEHDNIDDFGYPAWDLIEPNKYFSSPGVGDKTVIIHTSRGCPFGCEFCVRLGRKLRYHSLDHIYENIVLLNKKYGVTRFRLGDEGFPINIKFTKSFCRYVIEKGDNFVYFAGAGLRLNVLDDEVLELMKKANFETLVSVGIESGVPAVRTLMNKSLMQGHIYRGISLLHKHGFKPSGNFILGFPGETKKDMEETIKLSLKLKLWGASFTPFIPLPGSVATNKLMENGELPKDFDFSKIDLDAVLYAPKGMMIEELDKIRRKAVFRFNIQPRMLWYHITGGRLLWTIVKFTRIFLPQWMIPKAWRRCS